MSATPSTIVSVIDTATDTVSATIRVAGLPQGVAVTPGGSKVYVASADYFGSGHLVSVIDTATDTVSATIPVGGQPQGVAVTPDGSKVYVANEMDNTVSVIDTATNTVSTTIAVGGQPFGVAVTPDGSKIYVANEMDNTVSVIDTATNTVSTTIPVGPAPIAFGVFIQQQAPKFAGVPGSADCIGVSFSALAKTYGGVAAAALGYSSVNALQDAIKAYCGQ
jgi:YVTN family beta-propeller protein